MAAFAAYISDRGFVSAKWPAASHPRKGNPAVIAGTQSYRAAAVKAAGAAWLPKGWAAMVTQVAARLTVFSVRDDEASY
jgi:hypothetical protein